MVRGSFGAPSLFDREARNRFGKGYPEYDADQPRSEDGKWTPGGGTSGGYKPVSDKVAAKEAATGWEVGSKARVAALAAAGIGVAVIGGRLALTRGLAPIKLQPMMGPGGITILNEGVDTALAQQVRQALALVPKAHMDFLNQQQIKFVVIKSFGDLGLPPKMAAAFHPGYRAIVVSQQGGDAVKATHAVLHEVGHAIDLHGRFSRGAWNALGKDASVFTPATKRYILELYSARYGVRQIKSEIFADVYAAKLMQAAGISSPHFRGYSQASFLKAFKRTSAYLDNLDMSRTRGRWGREWHDALERRFKEHIASGRVKSLEQMLREAYPG